MTNIAKEHLHRTDRPDLARRLFRVAVDRVTIETSSYCNRRCGYCPNANVDRLSARKYLPEPIFTKLLHDLAEIDYGGDLVLHLYNEPLADPEICDKIAQASAVLPKANIEIYSNGDYLDRAYLDRLRAAGLRTMVLSIHLSADAAWSDDAILARLDELSKRIGIPARIESMQPGQSLLAHFDDEKIRIVVWHRDYYSYRGSDRGGLLDNIALPPASTKPCLIPLTQFYVGWDGSILPCCHVHPDAPQHQAYKIGRIDEFPDIFAAYANSKLVDWRRTLLHSGTRQPPCHTCPEGVEEPQIVEFLDRFVAEHAK